jgi:hypothetical protein
MYRRDVEFLAQRSDVQLVGLDLPDAPPDLFEPKSIPEFIRAAKESFPAQLGTIEAAIRQRSDARRSTADAPTVI